jgi:hypothetical protein
MWIEHPRLRTEVAKDPFRFQRQLAAEGLRTQRAVEDQDARRVRRPGGFELAQVGDIDRLWRRIGQ